MRTIRLRLSMAAALMAAGTLAAHAQTANTNSKTADHESAKPAAKPAPAKTAPAPAASSGMTVFIDPATGKFREPEPSEINTLVGSGQMNRRAVLAAQPQEIRGPGNSVGMVLDSSMESFAVVTIGPNGKLQESCVTGSDAARAGLTHSKAPAKKEVLDDK
jgi:hypothetical protein